MDIVVAKFGGSSVANVSQIKKIENILKADSRRKLVVVSAIGTDAKNKYKITDLLSNIYFKNNKFSNIKEKQIINQGYTYQEIPLTISELIDEVKHRHLEIINGLGLNRWNIDEFVDELHEKINHPYTLDEYASLGEKFSSILIGEYLGAQWIDPREYIHINMQNNPDNEITSSWMKELNLEKLTVVGGFFGNASEDRNIKRTKILGRGGSDLSGALFTKGLNAIMYENWTDKDGMYSVDPRLFDEHEDIPIITHISPRECRELAYSGFSILNDETIGPLRNTNIPVNIKNTNNPNHKGTVVVSNYKRENPIVGIAGRNGFMTIDIEKYLMNREVGFGRELLDIFASNGMSYEHTPSGIDNISIVFDKSEIVGKEDKVISEIYAKLNPDNVKTSKDLALIAVVGEGIANIKGLEASIFNCLSQNDIHVEMISKGHSENNIILGVKSEDYKKGIVALYNTFLKK